MVSVSSSECSLTNCTVRCLDQNASRSLRVVQFLPLISVTISRVNRRASEPFHIPGFHIPDRIPYRVPNTCSKIFGAFGAESRTGTGIWKTRYMEIGISRKSASERTLIKGDLATQKLVWTNDYEMKTESERSVINR